MNDRLMDPRSRNHRSINHRSVSRLHGFCPWASGSWKSRAAALSLTCFRWVGAGIVAMLVVVSVGLSGAAGGIALAQNLGLVSPVTFGDLGIDRVAAIDRRDGVIVAGGCFEGTIEILGTTLTSQGGADVWVAALSDTHELLWVVHGANAGPVPFGETGSTCLGDLAIGDQGQVVISGWYIQQLDIAGALLPDLGPNEEGFVVVLELADGTLRWAQSATGMQVLVHGVAPDAIGGVCFAGQFGHHNNINSGQGVTVDGVERLSVGGGDFFYGKADALGNLQWLRSGGGPTVGVRDVALDVAAADDGDCIVAGLYHGNADVGGQTVTSQGTEDGYLARYQGDDGALIWVTTMNGTQRDNVRALDLFAADGTIYAGGFTGSAPATIGGVQLSTAGGFDGFVAALALDDGTVRWARLAGGVDPDELVRDLATDRATGDVVVTGQVGDQAVFDATTVTTQGIDLFAARYNAAGDLLAVETVGGAGQDVGWGIAADASGLSVGGHFEETIVVAGEQLVSAGAADALVLRGDPSAGPVLSLPTLHVGIDRGFTLGVDLATNGAVLGAVAGEIDLPETCVALATLEDLDGDGVPDAIRPQLPDGYQASVFLDPATLQIGFALFEIPPTTAMPDGPILLVDLVPTCSPPAGAPQVTDLTFTQEPSVSFGNLAGDDVPGQAVDGQLILHGGLRGDCNGNGELSAADLVALGLELFDGDPSEFWETPGGGFAGDPIGCNAQGNDDVVDAGDVSCAVRRLFGLPCSDPPDSIGAAATLRLEIENLRAKGGTLVIDLVPGSEPISALALSVDVDPSVTLTDVRFLGPGPAAAISIDLTDRTGELDVLWFDPTETPETLRAGRLVEVDFTRTTSSSPATGLARFSRTPAPSLGSVLGCSIDVVLETVGELLFADGFETGDTSAWSAIGGARE